MKNNIIIGCVAIVILAAALFPVFQAHDLESMVSDSQKLIPANEAQFAKHLITLIQLRDAEGTKKLLNPKIIDKKFDENFGKMTSFIPNVSPENITIIGYNTVHKHSFTHTVDGDSSITYIAAEVKFSDKWVLFNFTLRKQGESFVVEDMHDSLLKNSLEQFNRFNFLGNNIEHYIVFFSAIFLLLFDIYVFALCVKTPIPKRKWLWIIFILIGFGTAQFNWTNGEFYFVNNTGHGFTTNIFNFPVTHFSQMLFEPFLVSLSIPLGAIIFLFKRKKWLQPD